MVDSVDAAEDPPEEPEEKESWVKNVGSWIALIGVIGPSLMVAGFMPDWNVLPLWGWLAIASALGGIGTAMAYTPRMAAFIGGLIGGACVPLAFLGYAHLRGQLGMRIFRLELLIPGAIGALPGILAYYAAAWLLPVQDDGFDRPFLQESESRFGGD